MLTAFHRISRLCTAVCAVCLSALFVSPAQGQSRSASYTTLGDYTTSNPVTVSGITVTGSGPLRLASGNAGGLSIRESALDTLIFGENESALFSFNGGGASEVMFSVGGFVGFDPICSVEGFDTFGVSLGRVNVRILELTSPYNVSAVYGNRVISAFRLRGGPAGGVRVGTVSYVAAPVNATVSGRVTLQGASTNALPVTFEFRPTDGSAVQTRTATPASDGSYQLTQVPRKTYSVRMKAASWLAKAVTIDTTGGDVTNLNATLPAGDVNGDNIVDVGDLALLIAHYNQASPNSGYLAAADFNGDGKNDLSDLLLLIGNYNQSGD